MKKKQKVLILYLAMSTLDSEVIAWSFHDGTGKHFHMPGDSEEPPYSTGIDALLDGWRLFQASPLQQHSLGDELRTGYLKYEFFFEKIEGIND